jgi:hypothetical protein
LPFDIFIILKMSNINAVTTALMPISQALAWFFVLSPRFSFYKSVTEIASFYCAWALYKRFVLGDSMEFGYITMALLALMSHTENRKLSIAATALVLANFGVFAYSVFTLSAYDLAKGAQDSTSGGAIVWAYVFKAYFLSSICFWSIVLFKFTKYPGLPQTYTPVGSSGALRAGEPPV